MPTSHGSSDSARINCRVVGGSCNGRAGEQCDSDERLCEHLVDWTSSRIEGLEKLADGPIDVS